MPPVLYNQNNKLITDRTPILTEHNGTNGEEVTVNLHLVNEDKNYRYDDIVVKTKVKDKSPVSLLLSRISEPAALSNRIEFKRLKPGDAVSFKATIRVPQGTRASFIRGSMLAFKWKKYPI